MRTTLDLENGLYRKAKIEAARRGVSLKQLVETSLSSTLSPARKSHPGKRIKFPIIGSSKIGKLNLPGDIARLSQQWEDYARYAASFRH